MFLSTYQAQTISLLLVNEKTTTKNERKISMPEHKTLNLHIFLASLDVCKERLQIECSVDLLLLLESLKKE